MNKSPIIPPVNPNRPSEEWYSKFDVNGVIPKDVDTTKNSREEFGARFKGIYKIKIWDDIEINNSLELFSNYVESPQNIDVNWEFTTVFPVNDFIKATLSVHIIYDDDTEVPKYRVNDAGENEKYNGKGIQVREMLTLGFYMKF